MAEDKYIVEKCAFCHEHYDAYGPFSYLEESRIIPGFCSLECFEAMKQTYLISDEDIKDPHYLKAIQCHNLADWIICGGLERLIKGSEE